MCVCVYARKLANILTSAIVSVLSSKLRIYVHMYMVSISFYKRMLSYASLKERIRDRKIERKGGAEQVEENKNIICAHRKFHNVHTFIIRFSTSPRNYG